LPDNLDGGPCCALTTDNVPWFGQELQDAFDICWRDCGIELVSTCRVRWTPLEVLPLTGFDCGYRLARFELLDGAGNVKWSGTLRLLYSRTWLETDPAGTPLQRPDRPCPGLPARGRLPPRALVHLRRAGGGLR
jgi:hypothetical protein